jgi:hypothetical protein
MNVLPRPTTQDAVPRVPHRAPAQITPVRPLDNAGERPTPQSRPQASREQREEVINRLDHRAEPDPQLPLKGRRAVAAYNALSQADEQAYTKQLLGFEITI